MRPIAIFGFGRSGTTWLSDIISKSIGGLILFEPFHPAVWDQSEAYVYSTNHNKANNHLDHLKNCYDKKFTNPWLIRNHLGTNPLEINKDFVETVWGHSKLIGFKAIRTNLCIPQFTDSHECTFIIRDPLSVLASILNRPRFFEEYGWEKHLSIFDSRLKEHALFSKTDVVPLREIQGKENQILALWLYANVVAIYDCNLNGVPVIKYEDLYVDPYGTTKSILKKLGIQKDIHPSYIFTPSMLTLKTLHTLYDQKMISQVELSRFFWEKTFSAESAKSYLSVLKELSSTKLIKFAPIVGHYIDREI